MSRSGFVRQVGHAKKRPGRFRLAAGAAVVAVAVTGVAYAGGTGSVPGAGAPSSGNVLAAPEFDAESSRRAAVRYLVGQGASAEEARQRMANQGAALKAAAELRTRAPDSVGSLWLDKEGHLMVRVLDDAGKEAAEAVGATPVFSTFASADVEAARDTLAEDALKNPPAGFSGALFEIDEGANKVIARYLFDTADGVVPEAATELGELVTATAEVADLSPQADVEVAGATMEDSEDPSFRCTAAWAVDITDGNGGVPKNGVMTVGHCFELDSAPEQTKFEIDTVTGGNTPATGRLFAFDERGDYGVLELTNGDRGSTTMNNSLHVVEAVQEPVAGSIACKDGAKTQQTCGEITRVNVSGVTRLTADGPATLLRGMTRADICSEARDSGAPVYNADFDEGSTFGVAALGILSGGVSYLDSQNQPVCGEKVGKPNDSLFTPLSGIDTEGRFRVRISGG